MSSCDGRGEQARHDSNDSMPITVTVAAVTPTHTAPCERAIVMRLPVLCDGLLLDMVAPWHWQLLRSLTCHAHTPLASEHALGWRGASSLRSISSSNRALDWMPVYVTGSLHFPPSPGARNSFGVLL